MNAPSRPQLAPAPPQYASRDQQELRNELTRRIDALQLQDVAATTRYDELTEGLNKGDGGRFRFEGYVPEYNLSSAHVEDAGTTLSVNLAFDMGDITLPTGALVQHCVMRFIGTARNEDAFETAGARFLSFNMNSYNADAYLAIGQVTLKEGDKEVKGIYGRAILESADGGIGVGLVGGVTVSHANGDAAWALQLTVDGTQNLTNIAEQQFVNLGTDQASKTVGYGIFSRTTIAYNNAFIRAFNSGSGAFLQWDEPNAGGPGVHATKFKVTKAGNIEIGGTQVVSTQGAAVADASGGSTVDTEARAAINALLARLRTHGLIAT